MTTYKYDVSEVPNSPSFVILTTKSTYIPGDERSRTNPGHGYPGGYEKSWYLQVFDTEEEWATEVKRLQLAKSEFKAGIFNPAQITTEVNVRIEKNEPRPS